MLAVAFGVASDIGIPNTRKILASMPLLLLCLMLSASWDLIMLIFILAEAQEWMEGRDVQNVDIAQKGFCCAYI